MIKYFATPNDLIAGVSIARLTDDGLITWLGDPEKDIEYLAWLAEGNTPEEWNIE